MTTEEFNKLSKLQQRVAIAKDVVAQVGAEKYIAAKGTYYSPSEFPTYRINQETALAVKACHVCGLGAMLVSAVRLGNEFDSTQSFMEALLPRFFSRSQRDLIECAFEGWNAEQTTQRVPFAKTQKFFKKNPNSNKRLAAIFRNIIKNKGTFKP